MTASSLDKPKPKQLTEEHKKAIKQRLHGNGIEPETPELILSRIAPSYRVAMINFLTELGVMEDESGWTEEDEAMFQIENVGAM